MPAKVILEVKAGPIQGQVFTFDEHDNFLFGRSADCHARLSDDDITASRHHFILEANPPDARVRDLGSLNGTYVDGVKYGGRSKGESPEDAARKRFPEVNLRHGAQIRVGETVFAFRVEAPAVCCACALEIPDAFKSVCQWVGSTHICPQCREKADQAGVPPKALEPLRCGQCGRDVADEVGDRRGSDYVCQSCRARAEADPGKALVDIVLRQARSQGPVEDGMAAYDIGALLGKGGMGAVYLARRKADGSQVALKVMLSKVAVNEYARNTFQREIQVMHELRHPRIVNILEHGSSGSVFYFVMEFCPGGGLDGYLRKAGGRLPVGQAVAIMLEALDGLAHAHEKGFVHRDLKPPNILLSRPDGGGAKVSDFGFAKSFEKAGLSGMTATGAAAGTFTFMPREQIVNFKFVKPPADVWSMSATLYHLLTGRYPLDFPPGADPVDVILRGGVVPIRKRDPGVPEKLAAVIDRGLAEKVPDRYPHAGALRDALAGAT